MSSKFTVTKLELGDNAKLQDEEFQLKLPDDVKVVDAATANAPPNEANSPPTPRPQPKPDRKNADEKPDYSGNTVIGRIIAKDKGFIWVPVAESKNRIAALPVERTFGGQVREALLADTPEHALPFNFKWSIEDCRVVPAESVGPVEQFAIELNSTSTARSCKSHSSNGLRIRKLSLALHSTSLWYGFKHRF
ncbi:MAG: hypothetical protein ACKV2Q_15060 [Planctomycetaceae bacterium]